MVFDLHLHGMGAKPRSAVAWQAPTTVFHWNDLSGAREPNEDTVGAPAARSAEESQGDRKEPNRVSGGALPERTDSRT